MIKTDINSQEIAKDYVLNKTLIRPKTKIWSPVLLLAILIFIGACIGIVFTKVLASYLSLNSISSIMLIIGSIVVSLMLGLKQVLILLVECYQHYAPEKYRRLCLCKPTCSEYALIVLKKYSLFKAVYLIYIRLTKTCRDSYKIDYP